MAGDDKITTEGRKDNAALPVNASDNDGGAERYPSAGAGGLGAGTGNPAPPQGAGDSTLPEAANDRGDGKR